MINPKILFTEKPLKVKINKIAGNLAELVFSDLQSVSINIKFLPLGTCEGQTLYLDLLSDDQLKQTKREVAKAVLEEILDSPNVRQKEKNY